jgi:hypothetical protein
VVVSETVNTGVGPREYGMWKLGYLFSDLVDVVMVSDDTLMAVRNW